MIKVTMALRSRDDWTPEETLIHYREHHAALVAASSDFTRSVYKYVQNYVIRSDDPVYSNQRRDRVFVSQLWVPSAEALKAASTGPAFQYIGADERRFVCFDDIFRQFGIEYEIFDFETSDDAKAIVRRPRINLFVIRSRKADSDALTFQQYWRNERAASLVEEPLFQRHVRRYVQTHALANKRVVDIGTADVIDEFAFATREDAAAFWAGYRGRAALTAMDDAMTDQDKSWAVLAESRVICAELIEWTPPAGD